jgi:sugar phosphate isomerase/epimerase
MKTSRIKFLQQSIVASAGIFGVINSVGKNEMTKAASGNNSMSKPGSYTINIFSKNLHWLNYYEMAEVVSAMGFDGVDLTVRANGHVLPERVEEDLPKAVEALKKKGLHVYMITTSITRADDAYAESILKTASALGIAYYRLGWSQYDDALTIDENIRLIKERFTALADLNKKYNIKGHYQNHSGTSFGAPIWDLAKVLTEINSPWIGSQYDILHATIEGANAWPLGLKSLKSYVGSMDIKDFHWIKNADGWKVENVPLGAGMVDFKTYFNLLKKYSIEGPFCIHYEYALGGAENGATTLTINKEEVLNAMKRDLSTLKKLLREAQLK